MSQRHGWDIRTRMLAISLGPALLLTLLLTAYFTYSRLQDLRQELTHTGQLIADQLAPAAEYGVIAGNTPVLQKLLQATLDTPHVRFIEVRDRNDNILVYVEQLPGALQNAAPIDIFHSTIQRQRIALASDPLLDGASEGDGQSGEDYLGRVVVGMSNDAFSQRQQEILLKAALLAAFALILTFLVARRLAQRLSAPISTMGQAVEAIQSGDYKTSLPILDDGEIGDLARHINNLASGLDRASREQEQAISQLISAREEAEQANRAKSDFLAMMSHELRTPMNGVLGMLQLLETTEQTREQAEYTALATESTEHLLKVINDILDFSRIERGALELECIPFNLLELVQGSALVFQHSAQQRGLALELQIQAGLENIEVCGDPTRIRQILVNLLGNALKFTEEGAIHLSLEWQALDHDVLWLTCAVHDSGIGISPERLEHMFDAFQQADSSISRRYGGTGLGLAIARTLAERMGGTLQAESKEGSGSTFTLEIPLPFQQSPAHRQQAAGDAAPGRRRSGNPPGRGQSGEPDSHRSHVAQPRLSRHPGRRRYPGGTQRRAPALRRDPDGLPPAGARRLLGDTGNQGPGERPAGTDHRPDRQRPAGRSGELPAGGNERLPGQAIQTGGIATHTATLDRLAAGTPRDIERNRTRGAGMIYDKGGKRTRE